MYCRQTYVISTDIHIVGRHTYCWQTYLYILLTAILIVYRYTYRHIVDRHIVDGHILDNTGIPKNYVHITCIESTLQLKVGDSLE
jgi:hypothetical protein